MSEIQQNLYKHEEPGFWVSVQDITQVTQPGCNYVCELNLNYESMLEPNLQNVNVFQPGKLCLVVFSEHEVSQDVYFKYQNQMCFYQTRVADDYQF